MLIQTKPMKTTLEPEELIARFDQGLDELFWKRKVRSRSVSVRKYLISDQGSIRIELSSNPVQYDLDDQVGQLAREVFGQGIEVWRLYYPGLEIDQEEYGKVRLIDVPDRVKALSCSGSGDPA